ncbi:hypothetical protein BH23ACT11_BH23ACT11_09360 [soil metagenome]
MRTNQIVKSLLAGVAVAVVGVPVVLIILQIGFLTFILSGVAGYGAGTLVHRAGGRNGGPLAMATSGVAVFAAFTPYVFPALLNGNFPIFVLLSAAIAVGIAVYSSR